TAPLEIARWPWIHTYAILVGIMGAMVFWLVFTGITGLFYFGGIVARNTLLFNRLCQKSALLDAQLAILCPDQFCRLYAHDPCTDEKWAACQTARCLKRQAENALSEGLPWVTGY